MPDVADRIAAQGATSRVGTPEQARTFIKTELEKWTKVIAAAGIRAE